MNAYGRGDANNLDEEVIGKLISLFNDCNELAKVFRMARDRFHLTEFKSICIRLLERRCRDGRQFNLPTSSEVAALCDTANVDSCGVRDVVIEERSGILKRINEKHPSFMSMQYPILFLYREDGYRSNIKYKSTEIQRSTKRTTITIRGYYAYLLNYRADDGSMILYGG